MILLGNMEQELLVYLGIGRPSGSLGIVVPNMVLSSLGT
jgi:hypothetical protein